MRTADHGSQGKHAPEQPYGLLPRNEAEARKLLLNLGKIKAYVTGSDFLTEDVVIGSPSQATNIVHGESKNG